MKSAFWLVFIFSMPPTANAASCAFSTRPVTTPLSSTSWLNIWEESDQPEFYRTWHSGSNVVTSFRSHLSRLVPIKQDDLLKRQRAIFEVFGKEATIAYDQLLTGAVGNIHPMRCLEGLLLHEHLVKQATDIPETEFAAHLLKRGNKIRIYQLGGTSLSPAEFSHVHPRIMNDIAAGWTFATHIHNHPFIVSNLPDNDIAGTLIPSGTVQFSGDLMVYEKIRKEFGLADAWITNGFDSLTLPTSQAPKLWPQADKTGL